MNTFALINSALLVWSAAGFAASHPPYPRSDRITGIQFHEETLQRSAPGSDIWSCTWASNNDLFATWGDGGGFGGTDAKGRASIGVARITGEPPEQKGINLWGGYEPQSTQAPTDGKGVILAVDNLLYLFVSEQNQWNHARLWKSSDNGLSWNDRGWIFPESHKAFAFPGMIEFGRAQTLNQDGYIYGFSDNDPRRLNDKKLYLFRVKRNEIETLESYDYFAGDAKDPKWSRKIDDRQPVFENAGGIGWGTTCVYHPVTRRFLLSASIDPNTGDWGLYEAPNQWGPWKTIAYGEDLPKWTYSPAEKGRPAYLHTFPAKWMSSDGKTLWCVFDRGDHFNLARCTLQISATPERPGASIHSK